MRPVIADSIPQRPATPQPARRARAGTLARLEFFFVAAAVFFAPMNFLRVDPIYFTLGDLCTVVALILMMLNRGVPLSFLGPFTPLWVTGLGLLTTGLMASSIVNGDPQRGVVIVAQYIFAYFLIPLIVVTRPRDQIVKLLYLFIFSIILMVLFGWYKIEIVGERDTRWVSGSGRMQSFVERENECATLIALTIPLVFWLAEIGRLWRIAEVAIVALLLYGIMLTGSNTGLICAAAGFAAFHLATFSVKKGIAVLALTVVAGFLLMDGGEGILPATFQKRVMPALVNADISEAGTYVERVSLMKEALSFAPHTLVFGFGADQYRDVSVWNQPVHDVYLLLLTEGGAISPFGLLVMLCAGLGIVPRVLRLPGGLPQAACTFAVIGLFGVAIAATPHVYGRFWVTPLALAIGVSVSSLREVSRQTSAGRGHAPGLPQPAATRA
jgi:hypothetical protein